MYPKQASHSQLKQTPTKTPGSKREQICRMLITKFRNKFNINLSTELALDSKMVDHIN
jgi:hypothetical protein